MGYGVRDIIPVVQHFVVPETDYLEADLLDVVSAFLIGHLPFFAMRVAVDLDHEAGPQTDEVDDVLTWRMLSSEFEPAHPFRAKDFPHSPFSVSRVAAHLARASAVKGIAAHQH